MTGVICNKIFFLDILWELQTSLVSFQVQWAPLASEIHIFVQYSSASAVCRTFVGVVDLWCRSMLALFHVNLNNCASLFWRHFYMFQASSCIGVVCWKRAYDEETIWHFGVWETFSPLSEGSFQIFCKLHDTLKLCTYITQSTLFLCFIRDGSVYILHTIVVASRATSRDVECVGTQLNWLYSKIVSDACVPVPVVTSSYALLQADGCSVITVRASSSKWTDTRRPGLRAGGSGVYLSCHPVMCPSASISRCPLMVWHPQ